MAKVKKMKQPQEFPKGNPAKMRKGMCVSSDPKKSDKPYTKKKG